MGEGPVYSARFQVSGLNQSTNFLATLRKYAWLTLFLRAFLAAIGTRLAAQSVERTSEIKRVALDWAGSGKRR
jgi:hypothetical protein